MAIMALTQIILFLPAVCKANSLFTAKTNAEVDFVQLQPTYQVKSRRSQIKAISFIFNST